MTRLLVRRKLYLRLFLFVGLPLLALTVVFGSIKSLAESHKSSAAQQIANDDAAKASPVGWITVDAREFAHLKKFFGESNDNQLNAVETRGSLSIFQLGEQQILELSRNMHDEFNKCGGFVWHETLADAQAALVENARSDAAQQAVAYTIDNYANVQPLIAESKEAQIRETIIRLSTDYPNRRFNQPSGMASAAWIKNKWTQLAANRSDVSVEYFVHPETTSPQPSIILTVPGTVFPNEVVVLGGHQDSINLNGPTFNAPGADDDASGIASLTEAIRVLLAKNFRPQRTVKFMAYAAEEIGLRGSNEIAADFQRRGVNVVGVLQLDMTNYKSVSSAADIAIITDLTNAAQNQFVRDLITTYQPSLTVTTSTCGYGCSDHASWNNKGYAASFPFEGARSNPNIHSVNDTLEQMGNNAAHAVKFTNIALSYVGELAKGTLGATSTTPSPTVTPSPTATPTPTPTPTPATRRNVALAANGATVSASSDSGASYAPALAIDGNRTWAASAGWRDGTANNFPDWLQVNFDSIKTINEIDVYAVRDDYTNYDEPTADTKFSLYGITDFDVQYWDGSNWATVSGGSVRNNDRVLTKIVFSAISTSRIRIVVNSGQSGYSRIVELEAWSGGIVTPTPTPTPTITPTPTPTITPNPTPTATPATPTPTPSVRINVAAASNGAVATASTDSGTAYAASGAINGSRVWANGAGWRDGTPNVFPDWLQVDFAAARTINEVRVYAVRDDYTNFEEPTADTKFSLYGITDFDVQYWDGVNWATVPNGSVTNNDKVLTKITFSPVTTGKIRVVVNNGQSGYSRIVELEAWSGDGSNSLISSDNTAEARSSTFGDWMSSVLFYIKTQLI